MRQLNWRWRKDSRVRGSYAARRGAQQMRFADAAVADHYNCPGREVSRGCQLSGSPN
jgi:hypothetical protein